MLPRYFLGAVIGAGIGASMGYFSSQGGGGTLISNPWLDALVGMLVGLFIISMASFSPSEGCGESDAESSRPMG